MQVKNPVRLEKDNWLRLEYFKVGCVLKGSNFVVRERFFYPHQIKGGGLSFCSFEISEDSKVIKQSNLFLSNGFVARTWSFLPSVSFFAPTSFLFILVYLLKHANL